MLVFGLITATLFWPSAQFQGDYFGLWRSSREIMLAFGTVAMKLCWPLSQLQEVTFGVWRSCCDIMLIFGAVTLQRDYFGLWRTYRVIILVFCAVTGRLRWLLAQLLPHYFCLSRSNWEIILVFSSVTVRSHMFLTKLQQVTAIYHCKFRDLIPIQSMWDLWCIKWYWDGPPPNTSNFPCLYHSTDYPPSFIHLSPTVRFLNNWQCL